MRRAHQRRIAQRAGAHGEIDAVLHQVGEAVLEAHLEHQRRDAARCSVARIGSTKRRP
jgi:hypothetical protein